MFDSDDEHKYNKVNENVSENESVKENDIQKPNNFNMRQSFSENYYFFLQPFEVKQDFDFFSLGNTAKTFIG